ncbi:MAG: biotin--[acetyl-CoA-carboxylase] ligase [Candidatus Omnitrophica bacterium]|nr:biotin--[acetyl-CoA-carboxylase] ligase [Candidatus Omnitrophota bacterium]
MERAAELARAGAAEGTLVWARRQTKGRGRHGRVWESPAGGIYCSIILRPTRPQQDIPQLSLVAGLSVAETIWKVAAGPGSHSLRRYARLAPARLAFARPSGPRSSRPGMPGRDTVPASGLRTPGLSERLPPAATNAVFPTIRWPNDVLINDKKVAGIIAESKGGAVMVGIGINVTTRQDDLPKTATSLKTAGASCDPLQLTGTLYQRFMAWYDIWSREGFGPIRAALRPWIGLFGQPVHIVAGTERCEGTALDVDETGRLIVRLNSGLLRPFEVGEVTVLR